MKDKLRGLDAVRAIACLVIFTFHCHLHRMGPWAVSVFFVLSGFLLVYNYAGRELPERPGLKYCFDFGVKRIKKLYPLHILCMCVMLAFVVLIRRFNLSGADWAFNLGSFAASALFLQSWVPDQEFAMNLNGVAWYLSDLLFLYMCFPLVLRGVKRYRSRGALLGLIAAIVVLMFLFPVAAVALYEKVKGPGAALTGFDMWIGYIFPLYRLGDFAAGCALGMLFSMRGKEKPGKAAATAMELGALALSAFAYWFFCQDILPKHLGNTWLYLIPAMVFIYVFALDAGHISRLLGVKPVRFIAAISTEIFLIHQVVITIGTAAVNMLPIPLMAMKVLGLSGITVMTLLLSWLYSRYSKGKRV